MEESKGQNKEENKLVKMENKRKEGRNVAPEDRKEKRIYSIA